MLSHLAGYGSVHFLTPGYSRAAGPLNVRGAKLRNRAVFKRAGAHPKPHLRLSLEYSIACLGEL